MFCRKCFFYDLKNKGCSERHNMPAEEEKCYFFEPQVKVTLNQAEIRAVTDIFKYMKNRENPALTSLYEKIRKITSPLAKVYKKRTQDCIPFQDSF